LWHSVIVRGDTATITIGKNTTVQDLTRIASNNAKKGDKVVIGDNVYIGANASLDACTIEDNSFIGMGASVARGARVESFGVLAAGSHLGEGQVVPSG
jgi:carbonic anhydrase/acetyltransferase-like protein (isoleucine patch superfamily)